MKRLFILLLLSMAFAVCAVADEITFSFILGVPGSLNASAAGLSAGIAENVLVSDATTGQEFTLLGVFTANTGRAFTFVGGGGLVQADYRGSGANSVLITDPMGNQLVAGMMDDHGRFISNYPDGRGAFAGKFDVSFVSPEVLALFGLGPAVLPTGAVSATFAMDEFDGRTVVGQLGGGTVTVETVPEVATWMMGFTALGLAGVWRVRPSGVHQQCPRIQL
jgi:hypothetical protein